MKNTLPRSKVKNMKKQVLSILFSSILLLSACGTSNASEAAPSSKEEASQTSTPSSETLPSSVEETSVDVSSEEVSSSSEEASSSQEEVDPDDLWEDPVDPSIGEVDPNLLPKEGETYEKYVANTPHISEKLPLITIALNEVDGAVPNLDRTTLTTGNKDNKGDYYASKVTVSLGEENVLDEVDCNIKVRGNFTANYTKKPFRLKFDKKQAMPGFSGKFKNWVLLADVKDHSNLRNLFTFHLGDVLLGTYDLYSSHYQPVELQFIDSTGTRYWGTYLLCEQQEIKSGRVDIDDVGDRIGDDGEEGSYNGTDIGYFYEFDGYFTEERGEGSFTINNSHYRKTIHTGKDTGVDPTFTIPYNNRSSYRTIAGGSSRPEQPGFTMKGDLSSDDPTAQLNFIADYTENVYKIIYNATYNNISYRFNDAYTELVRDDSLSGQEAISNVVDVDSFVNMYLIQEIACDPDIGWSSFYLDVDFGPNAKDHLLRLEAPWDFDSAYGVRDTVRDGRGYYAATSSNPWLAVALNNDWFMNKVKQRYNELVSYDILSSSLAYLDEVSDAYEEAYARNVTRWGSWDETGEVRSDWARLTTQKEHKDAFKGWLKDRLQYLADQWLGGYDVVTHTKESGSGYASEGNTALLTNGTKYRYEAENAVLQGGCSARYNRPDTNASNDGYVGQISDNPGCSLTFHVNATKRKQAYIVASLSRLGRELRFNDLFDLYINGEKRPVRDIVLPRVNNETWHDWYEVKLNSGWLEEGENLIRFVTKNEGTNFDYIDVYSKDALS